MKKKPIKFAYFIPKLSTLTFGVTKFTISCLLTHTCFKTELIKIGPEVVNKRQTLAISMS